MSAIPVSDISPQVSMSNRKRLFAYWLQEAKDVLQRDPASNSLFIALFVHPGTKAKIYHRLSNFFYRHGWYRISMMICYRARRITGIEIHPAATIGNRLLIDHGMGIVIGETAEIGDDCSIYHGVTLGGVSNLKEKRHPTVKDHVLIGAESVVLGPITIGSYAKIGAQAVVLHDVEPYATAVGHPAKTISIKKPHTTQ